MSKRYKYQKYNHFTMKDIPVFTNIVFMKQLSIVITKYFYRNVFQESILVEEL